MNQLSDASSKAILYAVMDSLHNLSKGSTEELAQIFHRLLRNFAMQKLRIPNEDELANIVTMIPHHLITDSEINEVILLRELNLRLSRIQISLREESIAPSSMNATARRVFLEDIDTFSDAIKISSHTAARVSLEGIYEDDVKDALVEIIGERFTPTHSATEKSDLYTSQIVLKGQRTPAAFLLKSLRSVKVLDMKSGLGKRGNQVIRLVKEPAILYVVQHTGEIATDVIEHLEAQVFKKSKELGRTLFFYVMDGNETARVLIGYGKLE